MLLAETEGFEPSIQLPVYKLSRLARSTTLTSLLFYSHSNFPACSPDSYRDEQLIIIISKMNFGLKIIWGCKNRKKTTGKIRSYSIIQFQFRRVNSSQIGLQNCCLTSTIELQFAKRNISFVTAASVVMS